MKFSLWLPANLPWRDLHAAAVHAAGANSGAGMWRGLWLEDHFMDNTAEPNDGERGECLTQLTALAATVRDVRIGSLVLGNTYRHPAVVAKQAAAISNIADGRFVLGVGAGWQENEHRAFGLEFGDVPSRIRWFREALQVWTLLRDGAREGDGFVDLEGERYRLEHASLNPKPHATLPILIGGKGEKVMPKLVARYADEWNMWSTPDVFAAKNRIFSEALEREGRASASLWRTMQALVFFDDAAKAHAVNAKGRPAIGGSASELVDLMGAYAEAGVDEFILPLTSIGDVAKLNDLGDRFLAEVAALVP
ncbi:LLM class flavin-dependent oxidoreductase [Microbacterium stercoris]|uniref:LLM class flavin-dependent oxidoreductase n=1 Tax=Microbacterium stercoris TaxID=2820289 RepID=A0A939TQB1_9MICO|nr:LLM class flavin-dependent oxidoreductase [Microbacterium stercoris]MBO3663285.1 LLM class flavin-dependent oxidoreductase [Microbacterium stercoris]